MKKYVSPELDCLYFSTCDVLTTSGEPEEPTNFSSEKYGFEREWL